MARMNRAWHLAHPMPARPTLDERIAWHLEHAASCGCRAIPPKLIEQMRARGIDPPAQAGSAP